MGSVIDELLAEFWSETAFSEVAVEKEIVQTFINVLARRGVNVGFNILITISSGWSDVELLDTVVI